MKLKKLSFLLLIISLILVGCDNKSDDETNPNILEDGSQIKKTSKGLSCTFETLPNEMFINDSKLIFDSVDIYQDLSASGFGYYAIVLMNVDISLLDDKELYWLDQDQTEWYNSYDRNVKADVYYESKNNNVDFESMDYVGRIEGEKFYRYVFITEKESKNDFKDIGLSCSFDFKQDAKYKEGSSEINKTNAYTYYLNEYTQDKPPIKDLSEMDSSVKNAIEKLVSKI